MRIVMVCLALVGVCVVGCSNEPAPVAVEQAASPAADTAKSVLQQVADTGELGSGIEELRMALEEMKQTDSAKAEALLQDLDKLEASGGGPAAQNQAQQMLGKL